MESIFDLTRDKNDLPSINNNMASLFYREVQPLRNVQDTLAGNTLTPQYGNGLISLRWTLDNQTWWCPSKSYIKFDIQLLDKDGQPITKNEEIAPTMNLASSIVNKMQFKMNDTTVDSIDENLTECDTMMQRLTKGKDWMSRTVGNDVNFLNAYHKERLQEMTSNGCLSDVVLCDSNIEITGREALGYGSARDNEEGVGVDLAVNGVLRFFSQNSGIALPKLADVWKPGDVLNIKFQGLNYFQTYWVIRVLTTKDYTSAGNPVQEFLIVSGDGLLIQNAVLANVSGGSEFYRWRFGCAQFVDAIGVGKTYPSGARIRASGVASLGTLIESQDADVFNGNINIGQPVFAKNVNDRSFDSNILAFVGTGTNSLETDQLRQLSSYNANLEVDGGVGANTAQIGLASFIYNCTEVVEGVELGINPNSFFIRLLSSNIPANNVQADTIEIIPLAVAGIVPPNIRNSFKTGDLLILNRNVNAAELTGPRYCWVQKVDVLANNGLRIEVSGGNQLLANFQPTVSPGNNQGYTIAYRVRYFGVDYNNIARAKSKVECCWKPTCLGIFNYDKALPGGTKCELELTPYTNKFYQLRAVETPFGVQKFHIDSGSVVGDYRFLVTDVKLYICQLLGPIVGDEQDSYYIPLNEIKCHKQALTTGNLTQTNIDVMPSSYAFSLAFQDSRAGSRTDLVPSKFHVANKEELNLKRYSIRYAGLSLPQPDASLDENKQTELLVSSYIRNNLYSQKYFESSAESIQEWKERGIYFYHPFIKSGANRETRAYVITDFQQAFTNPNSVRLLLFEFYQKVALIRMNRGRVYSISVANA